MISFVIISYNYFAMYTFFSRKAKLLLRKKKFGETQIEKMDGQLENIERMVYLNLLSRNQVTPIKHINTDFRIFRPTAVAAFYLKSIIY